MDQSPHGCSEEAAECRTEQFRAQCSSGTHLLKTVGSKSNFIKKNKEKEISTIIPNFGHVKVNEEDG